MTTFTESHARLAGDAYEDGTLLKGTPFTIVKTIDNFSGYHGVIYRNEITRELVVAHRGTEFEGDKVRDLAISDAQMVLLKVNQQLDGAREAVELALALAKKDGVAISVTGHSLGGTLAQITAHEYGLRGETFNAYGAAGLYDVPKGGDQVVNHVRATDVVAAANPHFGKVQVYALQADVDALLRDERLPSEQGRVGLIADVAQMPPGKTHGVVQFRGGARSAEDTAIYGANSLINSENQALYEKHKGEFDAYRHGIQSAANDLRKGVMLTGAGLVYAAGITQQHLLNKALHAVDHNEETHRLQIEEQRAIEARNGGFKPPQEPLIFRNDGAPGQSIGLREQLERSMESYGAPKGERTSDAPAAGAASCPAPPGHADAEGHEQSRRTQHDEQAHGFSARHRDYALFEAIRQQLPAGTSEEKTAQVMLEAKENGIGSIDRLDKVVTHNGHAWDRSAVTGVSGVGRCGL